MRIIVAQAHVVSATRSAASTLNRIFAPRVKSGGRNAGLVFDSLTFALR